MSNKDIIDEAPEDLIGNLIDQMDYWERNAFKGHYETLISPVRTLEDLPKKHQAEKALIARLAAYPKVLKALDRIILISRNENRIIMDIINRDYQARIREGIEAFADQLELESEELREKAVKAFMKEALKGLPT